jgi:hypothetical protein
MFLAWVRAPSLFYIARLIERGRPELKNDLMTFLDLSADSGDDPSAAVAIARRSARILVQVEPNVLLPPQRLRRPCAAVAGAAVLLAVGFWLAQGVLFQPWIGQAAAGLASGGPAAAALGGTGTPAVGAPATDVARSEEGSVAVAPSEEPKRDSEQGSADAAQQKDQSTTGPQQAASGALAERIAADAQTLERLAAALEALANSPSTAPPSSAEQGPAAAGGDETGLGASGVARGLGPANVVRPNARGQAPARQDADQGPAGAAGGTELTETGNNGGGAEHQQTSAGSAESQGTVAGDPGGTGDGARQGNGGQGGGAGTPRGRQTSRPVEPAGDAGRKTGGPSRPPIPEHPQPTTLPKNPLDATRWADRLIKEADRRLREGEVSDAFLDRMGMSQADFRRFVVAWQRRLDASGPGPAATQAPGAIRTAGRTGAGEAVGVSGAGLARTIVDGGPDGVPGPSNLVQDDSSQVGVRFRPVVSAYFDELSRLAEKPKEPER